MHLDTRAAYEEYCIQASYTEFIESKKIFDSVRSRYSKNEGDHIWKELQRGRAILQNEKQLNQYLFSYGIMVKNQWKEILKNHRHDHVNFEIIDYACGQGLATILFFDEVPEASGIDKPNLILIEPSFVALERSKHILESNFSNLQIKTINKKFDDLSNKDLFFDRNKKKLHLFSNILDIEGFDITSLFNKIISNKGDHCFLAVSTDRDFDGGSDRLKNIYDEITNKKHSDSIKIKSQRLDSFYWRENKKAIYFAIELEVIKKTALENNLIEHEYELGFV